jgi:hypothetical protein
MHGLCFGLVVGLGAAILKKVLTRKADWASESVVRANLGLRAIRDEYFAVEAKSFLQSVI